MQMQVFQVDYELKIQMISDKSKLQKIRAMGYKANKSREQVFNVVLSKSYVYI